MPDDALRRRHPARVGLSPGALPAALRTAAPGGRAASGGAAMTPGTSAWVACARTRSCVRRAVDGVERVALAASFIAGTLLVAACAFPGRRLSPVERARARAAMAAFVLAGAGPLAAFVIGVQPPPLASALLALGGLALPLALGWAVVRYRLLDPPAWLRHVIVSAASGFVALLLAATATAAAWQAADATHDFAPVHGAALALATALVYQGIHSAATRLATGRLGAGGSAARP
jgi:hypothetical protein